MYDDYREQGFEPLSINLWENWSTIKYYARQYSYLFLRDGGSVFNVWKISNSIPTNFVVDTAQLVVGGMVGFTEATIRGWIEPFLTGVEETPAAAPIEFAAVGANPVVGHSSVRFSLPKAANVTLRVYSTAGAVVRTLACGQMPAGEHTVSWNLADNAGRSVGNGLYLYELVAGLQVAHARVSVVK
jgi:hypothetical protein